MDGRSTPDAALTSSALDRERERRILLRARDFAPPILQQVVEQAVERDFPSGL